MKTLMNLIMMFVIKILTIFMMKILMEFVIIFLSKISNKISNGRNLVNLFLIFLMKFLKEILMEFLKKCIMEFLKKCIMKFLISKKINFSGNKFLFLLFQYFNTILLHFS